MVFNFATAILIVQDYNNHGGNTTNLHITYTEYALSATELFFVCFSTWSLIKTYGLHALLVPIGLNYIFNIVFSSLVIHYYLSNWTFNYSIFSTAVAIICTFCLLLCGCFGGIKSMNDADGGNGNGNGGTSAFSTGGGGQLARV